MANESMNNSLETVAIQEQPPPPPQQQQQQQQQQDLDQENDRDRIIVELTRANSVLKANISTLYRTARAEIARKNERISELQANLDDLLFKRMNRATGLRGTLDSDHSDHPGHHRASLPLGASTSQASGSSASPARAASRLLEREPVNESC